MLPGPDKKNRHMPAEFLVRKVALGERLGPDDSRRRQWTFGRRRPRAQRSFAGVLVLWRYFDGIAQIFMRSLETGRMGLQAP